MTCLIVDGNNLAYRARYAYSLSFRGRDTSVTYGFMRMLISAVRAHKPQSVIVCWDYGVPGYRRRALPQYKANRNHKADPNYSVFLYQLAELYNVLHDFGVVQVRRAGIEADDAAYHASRLLGNSVILSNDYDLLQSVSASCSVARSTQKDLMLVTLDNFERVVGVAPDMYLIYRVLIGDSSDNITGCPGIGAKTAIKLLSDAPELTPEGLLGVSQGKVRSRLEQFFEDEYYATLEVIRLDIDRCGARAAVLDAGWRPYRNNIAVQWCMKNGFASLMENAALSLIFGRLIRPELDTSGYKVPVVWDYKRKPVGVDDDDSISD